MELFWSPQAVRFFISNTLGLVSFTYFFVSRKFAKKRIQVPSFAIVYLIVQNIGGLITGLSFLFLSKELHLISILLTWAWILSGVAWLYQIIFGKIIWWQMIWLVVLCSVSSAFAYLPGSISIVDFGEFKFLAWDGLCKAISIPVLIAINIPVIILGIYYVRKAPPRYGRLMVVYLILLIVLMATSQLVESMTPLGGLDIYLPFIFHAIFQTSTIIYQQWLFFTNPEFSWVLALRLRRLTCITSESGISLFDYKWHESKTDARLLAGLLQALGDLSFEVLEMGKIQEIRVERGSLLFTRGNKVVVGMITELPTQTLEKALKRFIEAFENRFSHLIQADAIEVEPFAKAEDIVKEIFYGVASRVKEPVSE
jgi:hypothetical protein